MIYISVCSVFLLLTFICICYIICITVRFRKDEYDVKHVSIVSTIFYFIRYFISDSVDRFNPELEQSAKPDFVVTSYLFC